MASINQRLHFDCEVEKDLNLLNIINNEIISDTQLNKLVFELLFNYDFFDLLHRCLCEQLTNSRVCDYTRDLLLNNL